MQIATHMHSTLVIKLTYSTANFFLNKVNTGAKASHNTLTRYQQTEQGHSIPQVNWITFCPSEEFGLIFQPYSVYNH